MTHVFLPNQFAVRNEEGEILDLLLVPAAATATCPCPWRVIDRATGEWEWMSEWVVYWAFHNLPREDYKSRPRGQYVERDLQ